jgi:hypothetical protein
MSICKGEEMKAFEEHWDYTGLSEHVDYHPDPEGPECIRVAGINRKEERKEGWRAALEWVLSIDSGFCNCGMITTEADDNEIFISNLTQIKQELEK